MNSLLHIGLLAVAIYAYLSTVTDVVGPLVRRRRWKRTHKGVNAGVDTSFGSKRGKHRKP